MSSDEWVEVDPKTGEPLGGLPRITVTPKSAGEGEWVPADAAAATPSADPNARGDPQTITMRALNAAGFGLPNRAVAAKQWLTGEVPSYSEALANINKRQEEVRKEYPWTTGFADAGTTTAAALGTMGMTGVPAFMAGLPRLWQRGVVGAAEGAAFGGAQGAGNTYSGVPSDYAKNLGMGSLFGAGVGAAAPYVGRAAGNTFDAIAERFTGLPRALQTAAEADAAGLRQVAATPGAMLPDAGPSMRGAAQGAVTGSGGPGRTSLVNNLTARDRATGQRIVGGVDNIYGPAPTPSRVVEGIRERMGAMGPAYEEAVNNARAIDPEPLATWLAGEIGNTRGPAQAALREVRGMLDIPTNPGVLDPHPRAMQAAREAVRGMRDSADDPAVRARLNTVYDQMTRELQAKVPGIRELDHQYAELGTQERAAETSSQGARVFQTDRENVARPIEIADEMVGRTLPDGRVVSASTPKGVNVGPSAEAFRLREAARGELDRIVGTNRNDLAALERILGQPQDWNSQKLALMFGQDRADALMNVLSRERNFRQTYQDVVQGPQTAQRIASKEALDASQGKIPLDTTLTGAVTRGTQEAINLVRRNAANRSRDSIAQTLSTTDPVEINQFIDRALNAQPRRDMRREIAQRLIERGVIGTTALPADSR